MKRTTSIILTAAGAAAIYMGVHDYRGRYSSEAIWQRQRPAVETHVKKPEDKKRAYDALRLALSKVPVDSREKRCMLEADFAAIVAHGIDTDAAKKEIASRSFEPYAECKGEGEMMSLAKKPPYDIAALAIVLGAVGFVRSFFRKKNRARTEPPYGSD